MSHHFLTQKMSNLFTTQHNECQISNTLTDNVTCLSNTENIKSLYKQHNECQFSNTENVKSLLTQRMSNLFTTQHNVCQISNMENVKSLSNTENSNLFTTQHNECQISNMENVKFLSNTENVKSLYNTTQRMSNLQHRECHISF